MTNESEFFFVPDNQQVLHEVERRTPLGELSETHRAMLNFHLETFADAFEGKISAEKLTDATEIVIASGVDPVLLRKVELSFLHICTSNLMGRLGHFSANIAVRRGRGWRLKSNGS